MTSGERAPDPREARSTTEFLARLQALKDWSGLTYRELSARAGERGDVLPRSTVANMLARATLPREELLTVFVRACGAPSGALEDWVAVRKELAVRGVYEPRPQEPPAADAPGAREDSGTSEAREGPTPETGEAGAAVKTGESGGTGEGAAPARARMARVLVGAVALAGLVLAALSVITFVRDGGGAHPPRSGPGPAPAAGDVTIRVVGPDLCLGERRGTRSGQIHQLPCAEVEVPRYSLKDLGGGRWRIVSDHADLGIGCSGIPSGGRIPDAAFEDSECGDPSRVESFTLEPYGSPVRGHRIVPAGSATPGSCVTVVGDRTAAGARLAQAPCAPGAAGQLFAFDRR
ncbi:MULTISPECIES: RICIN domain-containing protein [unclassified Streptomyces]|uniref:RICIN domain-containing protein n=1 Tax=unclassified Streptomyces TaxID=2593676 RepID=UPI0036CD4446